MVHPYAIPVKTVIKVKDAKADQAYEKQENSENLSPIDRYATGERPVVTAEKVLRGKTNDQVPTRTERNETSVLQRAKQGETVRNITVQKIQTRKAQKKQDAYAKQEDGEDMSAMDRLRLGERPLTTARKVIHGENNDHIPTEREKESMTTFERIEGGERPTAVLDDKRPLVNFVVGNKNCTEKEKEQKPTNSSGSPR